MGRVFDWIDDVMDRRTFFTTIVLLIVSNLVAIIGVLFYGWDLAVQLQPAVDTIGSF